MKVSALWLYPMQSVRGQKMEALDFAADGLRLDRWFGLRDVETGGMVGSSSAKKALASADHLGCAASDATSCRCAEGGDPFSRRRACGQR